MSILGEELLLRTLAALSEIADECGKEPARRTLSLRFLLAYTFVASGADPRKKWIWSDFRKSATSPRKEATHERMLDDYIRGRAHAPRSKACAARLRTSRPSHSYLREGSLVEIFLETSQVTLGRYCMVMGEERWSVPIIKAFRQFLQDRMKEIGR